MLWNLNSLLGYTLLVYFLWLFLGSHLPPMYPSQCEMVTFQITPLYWKRNVKHYFMKSPCARIYSQPHTILQWPSYFVLGSRDTSAGNRNIKWHENEILDPNTRRKFYSLMSENRRYLYSRSRIYEV